VLQCGNREVALLPIDDFGGNDRAGGLLEDVLAAVADLQLCRDARRQLDEVVVQERDARFETAGHGHVVDPLHRVIDHHDLLIELQRLVDGAGAF
jgi:hypothetical protein